jgi:hypothetical protein
MGVACHEIQDFSDDTKYPDFWGCLSDFTRVKNIIVPFFLTEST